MNKRTNRNMEIDKKTCCQMKEPLVTVLLPTFNEPPVIVSKAILSITNQTYKNIEVFVFDDSTNEETKQAIDKIAAKDSRVRIFRESRGIGYIKALNIGLNLAEGKYIARMDGDDISYPERFRIQVNYLEAHNDVGVAGGQIAIIDEEGNVTAHRNYPTDGFALWLYSTIRSSIAHPTAMMRKAIFDNGLRYREGAEDLDMWLRIMNLGYKINNVPEYVLRFRVQDNFGEKRTMHGRKLITKARIEDFDVHRPIFSFLSVFFGIVQGYMPMSLLRKIYNLENGRK